MSNDWRTVAGNALSGTFPPPTPEQIEAAKQKQALLDSVKYLDAEIREAQKNFIDKFKRLPPSYSDLIKIDTSDNVIRIACFHAYLTYLQEVKYP